MASKKTTEEKLAGPPSPETLPKNERGDVFAGVSQEFANNDLKNPAFARMLLHLKQKGEEEVRELKSKNETLNRELRLKTDDHHASETRAQVLEERSRSLPAKSIFQIVGGLALGAVPWLWDKNLRGLLVGTAIAGALFLLIGIFFDQVGEWLRKKQL